MNAFETTAVIEDASHLALRDPVPHLTARECRVLVLFDEETGAPEKWPADFFQSIQIHDEAFVRPPQGTTPPILPLDL